MSGVILLIRFRRTRRSDSPPAPPRIHPKCCSDPEIHLGWPKRLKLKHDKLLIQFHFKFAFNFKLRRYVKEIAKTLRRLPVAELESPTVVGWCRFTLSNPR
jgi:hypothetical protein